MADSLLPSPDMLLRTAVQLARPALDRLGVLAAPARDLADARRVITVDRAASEVEAVLDDPGRMAVVLGGPAVGGAPAGAARSWTVGERAHVTAVVRPGRAGSSEVTFQAHLEAAPTGRPRYADNAGVLATRAAHRLRSLCETGEVATLADNPAGRPEPDPYGD